MNTKKTACDDFFDFMVKLACSTVFLFFAIVVFALAWLLWMLAPWLLFAYVAMILAFLFIPTLRRWQDEYTPGWDWTKWGKGN